MNLLHRALVPAALLAALASEALPQGENWTLVWQDEFNGPAIDLSHWTHEVNAWGGGNNELQYYTARPQNSFIQDGKLVIRAIKETFTGPEGTRGYTSARLNTRYKGDWTYGRFEARAKLPDGQGLWPAFWMLPSDFDYGGWAASGEIDIFELRGENPTELTSAIHYGGSWPANTYTSASRFGPDLSQDFHTYAIEWEEGVIRWYFDDILYSTRTDWWSAGGPYPAPFDRRFHILLNVAVGGNFVQDPPADATYFPKQMEVDYVRVYRRGEPTPYLGVPAQLPGRIQAEDYDVGGQGFTYNDSTPQNIGGAYRPAEAVDLQPTTDTGGGHNIGWVTPGEWTRHSIVSEGGAMTMRVRVASNNGGGSLRVILDVGGQQVTVGPFTFGVTGGWQSWRTLESEPFELPAGTGSARFEVLSGEFNLNWIELERASGPGTSFILR